VLLQIKGKEIDLILDDWVEEKGTAFRYWTQLCSNHAHLVDEHRISETAIEQICGVQGCSEEADYYYDFCKRNIRND